jgi:hypothetical protein
MFFDVSMNPTAKKNLRKLALSHVCSKKWAEKERKMLTEMKENLKKSNSRDHACLNKLSLGGASIPRIHQDVA